MKSSSFVSVRVRFLHRRYPDATIAASRNGRLHWLVGAGSNGNQPRSPDNWGTLQRVSDMSGGDTDSGSFQHLAWKFGRAIYIRLSLHGRVRAAGPKGSRLPLVSLSPLHVKWTPIQNFLCVCVCAFLRVVGPCFLWRIFSIFKEKSYKVTWLHQISKVGHDLRGEKNINFKDNLFLKLWWLLFKSCKLAWPLKAEFKHQFNKNSGKKE